jgi:hypothetical protein
LNAQSASVMFSRLAEARASAARSLGSREGRPMAWIVSARQDVSALPAIVGGESETRSAGRRVKSAVRARVAASALHRFVGTMAGTGS